MSEIKYHSVEHDDLTLSFFLRTSKTRLSQFYPLFHTGGSNVCHHFVKPISQYAISFIWKATRGNILFVMQIVDAHHILVVLDW